jgi:hypothetical protein
MVRTMWTSAARAKSALVSGSFSSRTICFSPESTCSVKPAGITSVRVLFSAVDASSAVSS